MKILGIDGSSKSTGWGVIETQPLKLIEYNKINPTGITSLYQKLNLFYLETKKLLNTHKPDKIVIEECIFVRNVAAARTLSKVHGVISLSVFQYLNKEPKLYVPKEWKKLLGNGNYMKCEIQLLVCRKFGLMPLEKIKSYEQDMREIYKLELRAKPRKKAFENLSINIYGNCGLNNDAADALGMCLALEKEMS